MARVFVEWHRQGLFHGPPVVVQSHLDGAVVDADLPRPILDDHGAPVESQVAVTAHVSHLRGVQFPAYIARFIVAVVVNSTKRMVGRWGGPNIGKKVYEGDPPSVADRDTSPSILRIAILAGERTPTNHAAPCGVFLRPLALAIVSVNQVMRGHNTPFNGYGYTLGIVAKEVCFG